MKVGGRNFHANRLKSLTGVEALENQAKAILSDVHYYSAKTGGDTSSGKATWAVKWRVSEFEPLLAKLRSIDGVVDPIQAYTDLLHHRYMMASTLGRDVPNEEALAGLGGFRPTRAIQSADQCVPCLEHRPARPRSRRRCR